MSLIKPITRIGIWFDTRHFTYGGPTLVILGTILGLIKDADASGREIVILFNEPGDINWANDKTEDLVYTVSKAPNIWLGPIVFGHGDAEQDYTKNIVWNTGSRYLIASEWFKHWICCGMPFNKPELAEGRKLTVWGAGVDVDFYRPVADVQKTQDYFVYFKSQRWEDLAAVHAFLFHKHFNLRGTIMSYYNYDPEMLRDVANKSRFCIMLNRPETQGLASLEIMACNCPLFVIDDTIYQGEKLSIQGASSVNCMDSRCGLKSSFKTLEGDFMNFLNAIPHYRPREFVCESYSFESAAHKLRNILETKEIRFNPVETSSNPA